MNIKQIRECIQSKNIVWTKHCLNRINQRNILISDIKYAINNGNIIEYYEKDYPYPSCLILGKTTKNKKIHIVCGINNSTLYIITVYYPDNINWSFDMQVRRKNNEVF